MKLRTNDPWMPAPDYGRSLRGLTVNLLVRDVGAALPFHREVLGAEVVYHHPVHPALTSGRDRGLGAEIRLHGLDPDVAEAAARRLGYTVLAPATDKPHGLREAYLLDTDGYLWVPDVPRR